MKTYVLVHGAWRGGWLWQRVRTRLRDMGHEVFTPSLTGLADRSHLLAPEINLDTHIEDVVRLIEFEDLDDVVLCGHSYAGSVVSGVADRIPERIGALIYLDAFLLEDGECVYDALPPAHRDSQLEAAGREGDGWKVPPIPAEAFNVNAADRHWVDRQCTMQPIATFQQPISLSGRGKTVQPVTYVLTTGLPDSPFSGFYERAKERGWRTLTIDTGHDAMLDDPNEVTRILTEAAG